MILAVYARLWACYCTKMKVKCNNETTQGKFNNNFIQMKYTHTIVFKYRAAEPSPCWLPCKITQPIIAIMYTHTYIHIPHVCCEETDTRRLYISSSSSHYYYYLILLPHTARALCGLYTWNLRVATGLAVFLCHNLQRALLLLFIWLLAVMFIFLAFAAQAFSASVWSTGIFSPYENFFKDSQGGL